MWVVVGGMQPNTETSCSSAGAGASTTMSIKSVFLTLDEYLVWIMLKLRLGMRLHGDSMTFPTSLRLDY